MASQGLLIKLVTDLYFSKGSSWRQQFLRHLADHCSSEIRPGSVEESLLATAIQFVGGRKLSKFIDTQHIADRLLARKTASVWRKNRADLLLYSGFARAAFRASAGSKSNRLLFLYHPHHQIIVDLLRADADIFPESAKAQKSDREVKSWWRWKYADEEIALADGVIVASRFSRHSLAYAGFNKPTRVIPYFSKLRTEIFSISDKQSDTCRFLFVGQGVIRKGLHHLFRAWSKANLRRAELTCVCGQIDPNLEHLIPSGVTIRRNLSYSDLQKEYSRSHVFVMPSIIEGFGLVYNEARSYGNHVIYTPNTGAPDMQIDEKSGSMVTVGDISGLALTLTEMNDKFHSNGIDFDHIAGNAHCRKWEDYVDELVQACDALRRK
nr:glycosyltransferase family 4 protein [Bradyrhizobium ottawaense]